MAMSIRPYERRYLRNFKSYKAEITHTDSAEIDVAQEKRSDTCLFYY